MDFDIDAALDQLEKTLNQNLNHDEKQINRITETSSSCTSRISNSEILLLELDPCRNIDDDNQEDNYNQTEDLKRDLQELYTSDINDCSPIVTSTLPDILGQQDELSSTSLPLVVEQLEFEVRQEVLQHTLEQQTCSLLSPDLTTLSNDHHNDNDNDNDEKEKISLSISLTSVEERDEVENLSSTPIIETIDTSTKLTFQNEPDLIQHEILTTQMSTVILDSMDSIVNSSIIANSEDFITPISTITDVAPFSSSSDIFFTACNDSDEKSIQSLSEERIINSSSPSHSTRIKTSTSKQDFDLVKNILSNVFDNNEEEILDESSKESKSVNVEQHDMSKSLITNNNEDDHLFDEIFADINVLDSNIHSDEINRVDHLLKKIVNEHEPEIVSSSTATDEIETSSPSSFLLLEQTLSPINEHCHSSTTQSSVTTDGTISAMSVDEELIRVEQEWSRLTEDEKQLGSIAPEWISDELAPVCMKCSMKFSITRRRHHCRACGKVFCSTCCSQKVKLIHDDNKEDRACNDCIKTIQYVEYLWTYMRHNQKPRASVLRKRTENHD